MSFCLLFSIQKISLVRKAWWVGLRRTVNEVSSGDGRPLKALTDQRKPEICTSATWGYAALSLFFLSIYPSLSFRPFVCLSFVHLSSVRHQLFTRSRWIFQRVPDSLPLYLIPSSPSLFYLSPHSVSSSSPLMSLIFLCLCASTASDTITLPCCSSLYI